MTSRASEPSDVGERQDLREVRPRKAPRCRGCGGPHPFDTTLPSTVWNAVIRSKGLPDYLCLTCIVEAFAFYGESFTATLWGGPFHGLSIEVSVDGEAAKDATLVSEENTLLRCRLRELETRLRRGDGDNQPSRPVHPGKSKSRSGKAIGSA